MSDLIKRQDAIDAISTWDKFGIDERNRVVRWHEGLEPYVKLRDVVWAIEKMPSAERIGKWLPIIKGESGYSAGDFRCSECGKSNKCYCLTDFCPNCGARMVSE